MKELVKEVLNKNKKPKKITGEIIANPEHLKFVVKTRTGRVLVDATQQYAQSDNVVIYDNVIHSRAGKNSTTNISTV